MDLNEIIEAIPIKPYWREDCGVIYCADCLDVLKFIPDKAVDLVLTDPPYNIKYQYDDYSDDMSAQDYFEWQLGIVSDCGNTLNNDRSFLYLNYPEFAARMFWAAPEVCDVVPYEWISWIYNQHTGGEPLRKATRAWLWWRRGCPFIDNTYLVGDYKNPSDPRIKARIEAGFRPIDYDWWQVEQVKNVSQEKTSHPCQLPIELVSRLIGATTVANSGWIVLDPFLGSGTTAVAAKQLGRKYIGIEISEKYCAIAKERLRQGELF